MPSGAGMGTVSSDDPGTAARMARTVGRCAIDVHASEARFTRGRNLIRVGLTGKRGTWGVVFRGQNAALDGTEEKSGCETETFAFGD